MSLIRNSSLIVLTNAGYRYLHFDSSPMTGSMPISEERAQLMGVLSSWQSEFKRASWNFDLSASRMYSSIVLIFSNRNK